MEILKFTHSSSVCKYTFSDFKAVKKLYPKCRKQTEIITMRTCTLQKSRAKAILQNFSMSYMVEVRSSSLNHTDVPHHLKQLEMFPIYFLADVQVSTYDCSFFNQDVHK